MEVAPDAHLPRPTRSLEYERGINTPIRHLLRVTARGWFRTCLPRSRTRDKDLGAIVYLRRGPLRARKLLEPVPGLGPSGSPWGLHTQRRASETSGRSRKLGVGVLDPVTPG